MSSIFHGIYDQTFWFKFYEHYREKVKVVGKREKVGRRQSRLESGDTGTVLQLGFPCTNVGLELLDLLFVFQEKSDIQIFHDFP